MKEKIYNLDQLVSIEYSKLTETDYYIAEAKDSLFPWMRKPKRVSIIGNDYAWWTIEKFAESYSEIVFIDGKSYRKPIIELTFSNNRWGIVMYYDTNEQMLEAYNNIVSKVNALKVNIN